ncbi:MAG TPA: ABC transporter substrate-binding protein [Gammaproteobacteria bacterium]|nr:ABC transporter substrate-binding protein [Gammaproteobacteria bacterium]
MKGTAYRRRFRTALLSCVAVSAVTAFAASAQSDNNLSADQVAAAKKWINNEFQPSVLSKEDQLKELKWFIKAAEPYKGMHIKVVSETIPTHAYESSTLAKAFSEITGIQVTHDTIQEGDVVEKLQTQVQTGKPIYDAYINDDDFIGFHARYPYTRNLTDWMKNEGKSVTDPYFDLQDFLGLADATGLKSRGFNGKLWQLPDQSFINVYWFRKDWFDRPDLQKKFKEKYGYDLGVPLNWSAYEDIANFFKNDVKEIDGKAVFGHMDYGKKSPDLGWRFTDDWLGMAGEGDKGIPNGYPVDEWGIRADGCRPVGASVSRGGAANSPAAKYALRKYMDWLREYAPPGALGMDFYQELPSLIKGNVAQQIFWYSAFTATMLEPQSKGNKTVNEDGKPLWRMAPTPHGAYWEPGMKAGYRDEGSWTLLKNVPVKRSQAAWLYAQFVTSKTVDLKKSHEGLTFIRKSTVEDPSFDDPSGNRYGGLIQFFRGPGIKYWTPTGLNVPDYAKLAQLWWQNIGEAVAGEVTPETALDNLAESQDQVMERIGRSGLQGECGPKLNPKKDPQYWYDKEGAPKPKLDNEKPQGRTMPYDEVMKKMKEGELPL